MELAGERAMRRNARLAVVAGMVLAYGAVARPACGQSSKPRAKTIVLDSSASDVTPLLSGPPETVTMRSGLVALQPGKSVGKHSTGQHEEVLIVLEGRGEMTFADGSKLPVERGHAVYCPPQTEHNVTNTGSALLRYVYVVAAVPDSGAHNAGGE
jgi:quercetin dioxygenase-like cupin family protein